MSLRPRKSACRLAAGLAAAVVLLTAAPAASEHPAAAVLDSTEVAAAAKDGKVSAKVGITNLTGEELDVSARSVPCDVTAGDGTATLPEAQHTEVTVSVADPCDRLSRGLRITLTVEGETAEGEVVKQTLPTVVATQKEQDADWGALLGFFWSLVASVVLVAIVVGVWVFTPSGPTDDRGPFAPLKGLEATWSFKDSVVTNLTTAGGAVVLVLGASDFLKAALGPKAEDVVAMTAIAAAIALAVVGIAGLAVVTVRKPMDKNVSVTGLILGYVLAVAAAGGQVWTITLLLAELDLGQAGGAFVWGSCIFTSVLLGVYASLSLYGFLREGTKAAKKVDPLEPPFASEVVAAAVAAAALPGTPHVTYGRVRRMLDALEPPPGPPEPKGPGAVPGTGAPAGGDGAEADREPDAGAPAAAAIEASRLAGRSALP